MKKILKITGIALAAILVLLLALPFAFNAKIEQVVKSEGNKLLNAQFDFDRLDISLLRNFPQASVSLHDFWLKGVDAFQNDTLVYAGELTAAVNLASLIGGDYEISKVVVADTRLNAIVLEDGRVNWDVMKSSDDEPSTPSDAPASFSVQLKRLSVDNLTAVYDDRQGGLYAAVEALEATCSGDLGSDNTTIRLKAATPSVSFRSGGIPMLSRAEVKAEMDVDADLKNMKFTLSDNALQLNAIRAAIDGWVDLTDEGVDMDLSLSSNEIGFKEILSLIPAIYAKDFEGLRTDGVATLHATAKGSLIGEDIVPAFDVALDVKNAMFRYPSLPAGVDNINIAAKVQNPGGSIDLTTVNVNPFNFVLAGNPFSLTADVRTPVSDPDFRLTADGKLDLGKIKDVYPLEDMTLSGVVDADMSVAGRLSYIDNEQYDRVSAEGNISLSGMQLQVDGVPDVVIERSMFGFTPRYLELSKTTVKIGENDLTMDSRFENYMGYLLKGTTLKGTLNVSSQRMNLNDFISSDEQSAEPIAEESATEPTAEEQPASTTGGLRVPDNIDFRAEVAMANVRLDKMSLSDIKGLLIIKDSKVDMQNLSLRTMGGNVVANGSYATPVGEQARLDAGFALNNIAFADAYRDLDMVQSLAPIFEGLNGNFSGSVKVNTLLDDEMSPVLQSLNGSGSLQTKDLSLSSVKFIDQVATIVNKPELKNISAKDLSIDFTITDGRLSTKPFDLKLGDYTMNLSGTTGLDKSIDYRGKITLPASTGAISKLGTVDMTIGGTFSSPKVAIDMESLAKQAAQQAARGLGEKLFGGNSDTTQEAADSTQSEKKNVVGTVLNLFKKKN
ncbi:MAG: AsmA family protein [Alistipes sp.]|nr:AsmA family protein [Alistipes sp.]